MKIFMTGATGVLGRAAVPRLLSAGHAVSGVARTRDGATWLADRGAEPVEVNLFDESATQAAVADHDAVVHWATAIPRGSAVLNPKNWATNDRLRDEGTASLVTSALRSDVQRFIQQSITFNYVDGADTWLDEDAPLDVPAPVTETALVAEQHVARFTAGGGDGIVLRLSWLYGPEGASHDHLHAVAARKLPIIGKGTNYRSRIHSTDAATALVAALSAPSGTYNISDDDPARVSDELTMLADLLNAPKPRHVPAVAAKVAVGSLASLSARSQRVSNRRFKEVTGWAPKYSSARDAWPSLVRKFLSAAAD